MKLSIIVPFYERVIEALICLNSLQATSGYARHEYLLQDDASPGVFGPAVIPPILASVQRNAANLGFAANCNAAARRASGGVLFFVNQDVSAARGLSEGWDELLLAPFLYEKIGIVGARLLFPDGRIQNAGGLFDGHGQPFHRCLGWSNREHPEVNTGRVVSWTTGAALAIRRELFERLGGFDEEYEHGYFEDGDLCMRARTAGFEVWYEPRVTLVHKVGTSGGNAQTFMQNARRFKARWVDSGVVKPDEPAVRERWW